MFSLLISSFLFFSVQNNWAQSHPLTKDSDASSFSAKASLDGKEFEFILNEALENGPVVLYFFPSAYTQGCDLEASTFSEYSKEFKDENTTIIGVSADNLERLHSYSADPDFCAGNFPVASDPKGEVAKKYGLNMSPPRSDAKDVKGDKITHGFIPRTTFIIDENGKIVEVFSSETDNVAPDEHVKEALAIVKKL